MPYDNNKRAQVIRTATTSPTLAKTTQGPYMAPRLAKLATNVPPAAPREESTPQPKARPLAQQIHTNADTTPAKPVPSPNVTPRSSSRRTRVRSLSSTPNGSPSESAASPRPRSMVVPAAAIVTQGSRGAVGTAPETRAHTRNGSIGSAVSSSSMRSNLVSPRPARPLSSQNSSPTFFRADETKSHRANKATLKRTTTEPTGKSGFVYANGSSETPSSQPLGKPLRPRLAQNPTFSAEGVPPGGLKTPPAPRLPHSSPASTISKAGPSSRSRPTSPLKESVVQRRSANSTELQQAPNPTLHAASSSHRKSSSASGSALSASKPPSPRSPRDSRQLIGRLNSSTCDGDPPRASLANARPKASSSSQDAACVMSALASKDISSSEAINAPTSPLTSPLRLAPLNSVADSVADRRKALAADARRERKVLDLEISNSSLLAINRTLEREMRKQHSELRRYRRLTSAGRISLSARSKRSVSGGFSAGADLDDLSEFTEDSEDASSEHSGSNHDSDDLDADGDALGADPERSSSALAARRAQQRAQDEARLQADLKKHQEMLADSQRMNQSIKRCLGWTEDLLREGRRALAARVRPSDVRLGGHVLVGDDAGDEANLEQTRRRALLSPALGRTELEFGSPEVAAAEAQQAEAIDAIVGSLEELHISAEGVSDTL